jgi:hypothetical protein
MIYIRVRDFFDGSNLQINAPTEDMAKDWLLSIARRHFREPSSRMYCPLQIETWSEYE